MILTSNTSISSCKVGFTKTHPSQIQSSILKSLASINSSSFKSDKRNLPFYELNTLFSKRLTSDPSMKPL